MNILQVISTVDPEQGGMPEAFRQMAFALKDLGYQPETVTLDSPDASWLQLVPGTIHALGPSRHKYAFNKQLIPWLDKHISTYDAVVVHGIWQYHGFAVPHVARKHSIPYFVFVHGQLDPWFKIAFPLKHAKKWLYWNLVGFRALRDAAAVLFTSDLERDLARRSFKRYRAREAIIGFGISAPESRPVQQRELFLHKFNNLTNKRLLLFLSRLHPKKGCDLLIQSFSQIASRDPDLHLVIAGPDEDGEQKKLVALAAAHGIAERITWTGMLNGDLKWGAFHAAEVFVLPSHSENFGLVVAEALACGLPVLITDKVNIWMDVLREGAGFVETDTLQGTLKLLDRWLGCSKEQISLMRMRSKICFERQFEIHQPARRLVDLIERRPHVQGNADIQLDELSEKPGGL